MQPSNAAVHHRSIASRPALAALALMLFAVWFGVLETRGLFWPDEGRYAEIAREMQASGDYAGAQRLLQRMVVLRPDVQGVLDRLQGVPVDIRPLFVTADALEREFPRRWHLTNGRITLRMARQ